MPVRYMGTKRSIADPVRDIILREAAPQLPVVDLFAGIGAVSSSLANRHPVVANDVLNFISPLLVARFKTTTRTMSPDKFRARLESDYRVQKSLLSEFYSERLIRESKLTDRPSSIRDFMESFDDWHRAQVSARSAANAFPLAEHCMMTQYFSAGYFSVHQAIDLDAIRFAIDLLPDQGLRSWATAAWLATMSAIINSPGHTAQYLKPSTEALSKRIIRTWRRNAWEVFGSRLMAIELVGTRKWRASNKIWTGTAASALRRIRPGACGAIYADPPYTRDDYSRFYHVYETAYLYDYPQIEGFGRTRTGRTTSEFCGRQSVVGAFQALKEEVGRIGCPLILSYPEDGLLSKIGGHVSDIFRGADKFEAHPVPDALSRVGANGTRQWRKSLECIYVIQP